MLSDRVKRLLTAAVDGELDQVERRALQKVLQQSEDARHLYKKMKRDAGGLNQLARQGLPPHFSCRILQALGETGLITPSSIGHSPKRFSLPLWANFAAAAAVMMAVCAGTYMVIVLNEQERVAVANAESKKAKPEAIAAPMPDAPASLAVAKDAKADSPVVPDQTPTKPIEVAVAARSDDPKVVEPGSGDLLFTPFNPKVELFATVTRADLPPIFVARELDEVKAKELFRDSLKHGDAFHLDLFCRDTTKAFERLQAVMKAQGQKITVDGVAQERFNRKLKTHYVFFTEALSADEVAKLFQALAAEDKKAESKKDAAFDKLVVKPLAADSQKTLSILLGVDVKWLQPKKTAIDLSKPLSDSTAEKLAQKLGEKPGSVTAKHPDHSVLVLSFNPIRPNPGSSKEVKAFLEQRKDRKPNAVPLLIVLRTPEG